MQKLLMLCQKKINSLQLVLFYRMALKDHNLNLLPDYQPVARGLEDIKRLCRHYKLFISHLREYFQLSQLSLEQPERKLFILLESRVDSMLFRSGLVRSIVNARLLIAAGHVQVNNQVIRHACHSLYPGDYLSFRARFTGVVQLQLSEPTSILPPYLRFDRAISQLSLLDFPQVKYASLDVDWQRVFMTLQRLTGC